MSHATEVARSSDEMIKVIYTRADGVTYYQLGTQITVSWRGKQFGEDRMYFCHTHRVNACECTRRIDKMAHGEFCVKKYQSPERSEQSRCDEMMQQMGWTVIKMSLRRPRVVLQTKGIPDRKFYRGSDSFWFECKAEDGRQSEEQKKFQAMCERAGEPYVIGGLTQLKAFLKQWGEKVRFSA